MQAVVSGAENPEELIYKWYVDDVKLAENSDTHVPDSSELQKTIRVEVYSGIDTADQKLGEAEMFFSRIPVVYIDTENGVGITSKEDYVNADMKIQGNETYGEEQGLYDGAIEIRGRGNATWNNPNCSYLQYKRYIIVRYILPHLEGAFNENPSISAIPFPRCQHFRRSPPLQARRALSDGE